ncbi:MAG: polysaccharide deacetylase family protein [Synergistaceae bacterium]|jgi:peptidoglycan/xylan/chitin deacetylase (PgdA/CDA1 family)|nr:polysaccharide deacetylase family protein [Synergistaceae bacterium]
MRILSLKIYADTLNGYRDGVPRLLDVFGELDVGASFFFGMGAEGTGSPVSKFLGEGKEIVGSAPGILRDASKRGHDCGIYGWNPQEWRRRLDRLKDTTLESDIKRAMEYFVRRIGRRPSGFAAPGCRVNYISLRIQDDMRFSYCSDTFGFYPFMPQLSWKVFSTPQLPSTLPPMETVLKKTSKAEARVLLAELAEGLPDGLSVLPMNASVANVQELASPLYEFLLRLKDMGVKFMRLDDVAKGIDVTSLPSCEIVFAKAFGVPNEVAVQNPK